MNYCEHGCYWHCEHRTGPEHPTQLDIDTMDERAKYPAPGVVQDYYSALEDRKYPGDLAGGCIPDLDAMIDDDWQDLMHRVDNQYLSR